MANNALPAGLVNLQQPLTAEELRSSPIPAMIMNVEGTDSSSPVYSSDTYSEFWRINTKRYADTEEVRVDIPNSIPSNSIYIAVAADGTSTSDESWTVIRTYFNAQGNPIRQRIRFNLAWDNRMVGW